MSAARRASRELAAIVALWEDMPRATGGGLEADRLSARQARIDFLAAALAAHAKAPVMELAYEIHAAFETYEREQMNRLLVRLTMAEAVEKALATDG